VASYPTPLNHDSCNGYLHTPKLCKTSFLLMVFLRPFWNWRPSKRRVSFPSPWKLWFKRPGRPFLTDGPPFFSAPTGATSFFAYRRVAFSVLLKAPRGGSMLDNQAGSPPPRYDVLDPDLGFFLFGGCITFSPVHSRAKTANHVFLPCGVFPIMMPKPLTVPFMGRSWLRNKHDRTSEWAPPPPEVQFPPSSFFSPNFAGNLCHILSWSFH